MTPTLNRLPVPVAHGEGGVDVSKVRNVSRLAF